MKHTNKVVLRPNWVKVNITKDFSEKIHQQDNKC